MFFLAECYKQIIDFLEPGEMNPLEEDVHICTGPLGGGKAACNGDSGGPLVLYQTNNITTEETETEVPTNNENNEIDNSINESEAEASSKVEEIKGNETKIPILVGVVSWGISPCGEKGAPTVYTNVSQYMDFINSYVHS